MKDRIKKIILSENLTYSDFADKLNITKSSVTHIVNGRNKPSLDVILKILSLYDKIDTEWLLFGTGKMLKNESSLFTETNVNQENIADDEDTTQNNEDIISLLKQNISKHRQTDNNSKETNKGNKSKQSTQDKSKNKKKKKSKKDKNRKDLQKSTANNSQKIYILKPDKTYTEYISV